MKIGRNIFSILDAVSHNSIGENYRILFMSSIVGSPGYT